MYLLQIVYEDDEGDFAVKNEFHKSLFRAQDSFKIHHQNYFQNELSKQIYRDPQITEGNFSQSYIRANNLFKGNIVIIKI